MKNPPPSCRGLPRVAILVVIACLLLPAQILPPARSEAGEGFVVGVNYPSLEYRGRFGTPWKVAGCASKVGGVSRPIS